MTARDLAPIRPACVTGRTSGGGTGREGMILLNVLIVVAIASAAVAVMIAGEDIQVQRTIRLHDAAQAQAHARAGELSAVVALRRDGVEGAAFDAYSEPWAAIGQQSIAIPGGRFALTIADEQARFNLNSLTGDDAVATSRFNRLAVAAGLAPETTARIATVVANLGPLSDDALLLGAGVSPSDLARLSAFIVLLPPDAGLNLNTADARLLEALIDDPAAVRRILSLRAAKGQVTEADLAVVGLTGLGGYTSNHFALTATVSVGDVSQTTRSRLTRTVDPAGVHVGVTQRRRSAN